MAIFHGNSVGSDRDDFRQSSGKQEKKILSRSMYLSVCVAV